MKKIVIKVWWVIFFSYFGIALYGQVRTDGLTWRLLADLVMIIGLTYAIRNYKLVRKDEVSPPQGN